MEGELEGASGSNFGGLSELEVLEMQATLEGKVSIMDGCRWGIIQGKIE